MEFLQVVAAVAAVVAVYFAFRSTEETSNLRREDRLARVAETVADFGETSLRIASGDWSQIATSLPVARLRLEAAIVASGEQLPNCQALLGHVHDGLEDEVSLQREGIESHALRRTLSVRDERQRLFWLNHRIRPIGSSGVCSVVWAGGLEVPGSNPGAPRLNSAVLRCPNEKGERFARGNDLAAHANCGTQEARRHLGCCGGDQRHRNRDCDHLNAGPDRQH